MIGAVGAVGRTGITARRSLWTPLQATTAPVAGFDAAIASSIVLSGNSAQQWSSQIGNSHLTQGGGSAQLTYQPTGFGNYAPCLASDGGDWMQATIPGLRNYTAIDVYMVIQSLAAAAADTNSIMLWSYQPPPNPHAWTSSTNLLTTERITFTYGSRRLGSSSYTRAANMPQILNTKNSTTGTQLIADGSQVSLNLATGMTTTTDTSPLSCNFESDLFYLFRVGATNSPSAKIKELWIFPSILSLSDKEKMEGYLAHNNWRLYNRAVPLPSDHPYFLLPP